MATEEVYDLGLRLQAMRKRMGLTQQQLGDRIGVSRDAISHYENNSQTPPLEKVTRLASCLHTSVDYLLGLEDEPVIRVSGLSPEKRQVLIDFIRCFIDESACE